MDSIDNKSNQIVPIAPIVNTQPENGISDELSLNVPETSNASQGLTIILGGNNLVHANNVIQVNGDSLEKIAESIQQLLQEISKPLGHILQAIGNAVAKSNLG